ncbi:MAG: hypothetical protein K8S54_08545 [Spirochaetia bacterium]|nr:hypothetical protein [Spirochaetia bacterium]
MTTASLQGLSTIVKSIVTAFLILGFAVSCGFFQPTQRSKGAVKFYPDIPPDCNTTKGLKVTTVKRVTSEKDLIEHYGLTFRITFQDKISPDLYGALYYQDEKENKYCMALPDGRFATFEDSKLAPNKNNVMQDLCHPIVSCK